VWSIDAESVGHLVKKALHGKNLKVSCREDAPFIGIFLFESLMSRKFIPKEERHRK
jgi:hypothetical protein